MMKPNAQDQNLFMLAWSIHGIGVLVVIGATLLARLIVVAPIQQQRNDLATEVVETNKIAKTALSIRTDFEKTKQEIVKAEQRVATLRKRIPQQLNERQFLNDLSRLADEEGVALLDLRPGTVSREAEYSEMPIQLTIRATYPRLCRLLLGIAQMQRLVAVSEIHISSTPDTDFHTAEIELVIYYSQTDHITQAITAEGRHG